MTKTLNFTGSRSDCMRAIDEFLFVEVTKEKPTLNHLIMVGEHCCSALLNDTGNYTIVLQVSLDNPAFAFTASLV